jgi:hypothetical protein
VAGGGLRHHPCISSRAIGIVSPIGMVWRAESEVRSARPAGPAGGVDKSALDEFIGHWGKELDDQLEAWSTFSAKARDAAWAPCTGNLSHGIFYHGIQFHGRPLDMFPSHGYGSHGAGQFSHGSAARSSIGMRRPRQSRSSSGYGGRNGVSSR